MGGLTDVSEIYTEDFFEAIKLSEVESSLDFANIVKEYLNPKTAIDMGCGCGIYVKALNDVGIECIGYDGSIHCKNTSLIPEKTFVHDLRTEFQHNVKYEISICIEVAEHIDNQYSDQVIKTLTQLSDIVLFTAAPPGQGGKDHRNEQLPEYWEKIFKKYKFTLEKQLTQTMKEKMIEKNIVWWIPKNLMLFIRE